MISSLCGRVALNEHGLLRLSVGPIGIDVAVPSRAFADCGVGDEVMAHTSLVVREDSLALFGFASPADRQAFEVLLSVAGIGPKIALAALDVYSGEQITSVVCDGDYQPWTAVAGIGDKLAQRLAMELSSRVARLPQPALGTSQSARSGREQVTVADPHLVSATVDALLTLGFTRRPAKAAVDSVWAEVTDERPPDQVDVSELLTAALRHLSASHPSQ